MKHVKHIIAIANVEAKLLMRTKAIKIFSLINILYVLFFILLSHYVFNRFILLPGALVLKVFFWMSIFKILFSPFIVPVFIREDRIMDSFRALYPRPFSNLSYLLGKMAGFTLVMLAIDYFSMFVFFVSDMLLDKFTMSLWPYLLYPLIVTVPLSIFVFGMNAFLGYIKYPLVYVGTYFMLVIFLPLQDVESARYLDLAAITLPLSYSTFTGFFDFGLIVIQRMIYLCAGLGLVMGAVVISEHSRRSDSFRVNAVFVSVMLLFLAVAVWFVRLDQKPLDDAREYREELREHHNHMADYPAIVVDSCFLDLTHNRNEIDVKARLIIRNSNETPIDRILLKLNPGFEVTDVILSAHQPDFTFEKGILDVIPATPLTPESTLELEIAYHGSVDGEATYLHIPEDFRERVHRSGLTVLGKQVAVINRKFVVLPPEVHWYPSALPSSPVTEPGYLQRDLTRFTITVKTNEELIPISTGQMTEQADGSRMFTPDIPITQMALVIGPYQKHSIVVDDVEYAYYWIKKDFTGKTTDLTQRELEQAIREFREDIEYGLSLAFPFKRYQLIQIPTQFLGYNSPYDMNSVHEQPEMRLISEAPFYLDLLFARAYGYNVNSVNNVKQLKQRFSRYTTVSTNSTKIHRKINRSPALYKVSRLEEFTVDPFVDYGGLFSQYAVFPRGRISQDDLFNLIAVNRIRANLTYNIGKDNGQYFFESTIYHSLDRAKYQYLNSKSLNDILHEKQYHYEALDILNIASKSFFKLYAGTTGTNVFDVEMMLTDGFRSYDIDIVREFNRTCEADIVSELHRFADQKENARYEISNVAVYKYFIDNRDLYNVRGTIHNLTSLPGYITCTAIGRTTGINATEIDTLDIYFEPYSTKEFGLVTEKEILGISYQWMPYGAEEKRRINLMNNRPLPSQEPMFRGARNVESSSKHIEIVMDNLDDNCRIVNNKLNKIKRLFQKQWKKGTDLTLARFKGLSAPYQWTLAYPLYRETPFYGPVSAVYYKNPGDGQSVVEYTVDISTPGNYELYLSVPLRTGNILSRVEPLLDNGYLGETTVRVFADDGIHEDITDISKADGEWAYVGTYNFSDTTAVIQITDKTSAKMVIADAVKLRKAE